MAGGHSQPPAGKGGGRPPLSVQSAIGVGGVRRRKRKFFTNVFAEAKSESLGFRRESSPNRHFQSGKGRREVGM